jgi:hypothetical protein
MLWCFARNLWDYSHCFKLFCRSTSLAIVTSSWFVSNWYSIGYIGRFTVHQEIISEFRWHFTNTFSGYSWLYNFFNVLDYLSWLTILLVCDTDHCFKLRQYEWKLIKSAMLRMLCILSGVCVAIWMNKPWLIQFFCQK